MEKRFTNREIAKILRSIAAAYQVKNEDKFKIIAYERAADSIEHSTLEVKDLWDEGKLDEIPGIGKSIAASLDELFKKGKVKHFDEVLKGLPPTMFTLITIPGIGAKTAFKLAKNLNLKDPQTAVKELEEAASKGKIREIEGFGKESEKDVLRAIKQIKERKNRLLLPEASEVAEDILIWLKKSKDVIKADMLGSLRRKVSTVGDIDIAVASNKPELAIEYFTNYPYKNRILEAGKTTASIIVRGTFQVDLMVQPPESYGSLLQHFTGSKTHNIALRELAIKKGLSLSEYGIKKGSQILKFDDEKSFYNFLGMDWIPPEIRENEGEIEAALEKKLPNLIETGDMKGDLHIHSNFKIETSHDEGANSIQEIVKKARSRNYEYIALTEHNPSQSHHEEKDVVDILKRKSEAIEEINYSHEKESNHGVNKLPIYIFNGLEIDIRPNGDLAIPEKALDILDFAIVSIHASFELPEEEMTKRILAALNHPKVKILGHPTGRKLNSREGIDVDWEKIFEFCLKENKFLEINAFPDRLDLPDTLVREAVKRGVKIVISTDSHAIDQMDLMEYGVSVARRGWAEKNDVINTLNLEDFKKLLL